MLPSIGFCDFYNHRRIGCLLSKSWNSNPWAAGINVETNQVRFYLSWQLSALLDHISMNVLPGSASATEVDTQQWHTSIVIKKV